MFDTLEQVVEQFKTVYSSTASHQIIKKWLGRCMQGQEAIIPSYAVKDYHSALNFLYSYRGSKDTFGAYRRELEKLVQWNWFVRKKSILKNERGDIEAFIEFCLNPPRRWIGLKRVARYNTIAGNRCPNPEWKPFVAHVSKKDHKKGLRPEKQTYQFSQQALLPMFTILGSFYTYLLQEELIKVNPLALIRQKSKFIQKSPKHPIIRRLSNQQWEMVIKVAQKRAILDKKEERTVFILSCLYGMYLRISELLATSRWTPTMGDFFKDADGYWWFKTVGKGNKPRQIAVNPFVLEALKRYRSTYLALSPLPTPEEKTPLISFIKNHKKPLKDSSCLRRIVQGCFDQAADSLKKHGHHEESNALQTATVHWLRHTGISEDIKYRPREHVRDDAGHSSSATTDRYIDIELKERARSAQRKEQQIKSKDLHS